MKISELISDLSYDEIKCRKWRHPRIWNKRFGKLVFRDYAISEDGIIIRLTSPIKPGPSYIGKTIKGNADKKGYVYLSLRENNCLYRVLKHRVVWETWNKKIPRKKQINHIDGIKSNNYLTNLEIVTSLENIRHAINNGLNWTEDQRRKISKLHKGKKWSFKEKKKMSLQRKGLLAGEKNPMFGKIGERHPNSILTNKQAGEILRLRYEKKLTMPEISKIFKVSIGCINGVVNGYSYRILRTNRGQDKVVDG